MPCPPLSICTVPDGFAAPSKEGLFTFQLGYSPPCRGAQSSLRMTRCWGWDDWDDGGATESSAAQDNRLSVVIGGGAGRVAQRASTGSQSIPAFSRLHPGVPLCGQVFP